MSFAYESIYDLDLCTYATGFQNIVARSSLCLSTMMYLYNLVYVSFIIHLYYG